MSLTNAEIESRIASPAAIEHHYDVGNDFYALWLDPSTMSYTAANYDSTEMSLGEAQIAKLDYHATAIGLAPGHRVLDIGCGWGGFLDRALRHYGAAQGVGLTLSPQQKHWVDAKGLPQLDCRLESWVDHAPDQPYHGIVSIEAFEAFARPHLNSAEKIEVYREFFKRCHEWLVPGGVVSLQLIPYGNATPEEFDAFISQDIFPESNFPRLSEVVTAFEYLFEVHVIRNRRQDYVTTLKEWRHRLSQRRAAAVALVGDDTVKRYDRYFRISEFTLDKGNCDLLQLSLRKINHPKKG
jgi:cyclopropane-fatty-acyl-phospholipid synthase